MLSASNTPRIMPVSKISSSSMKLGFYCPTMTLGHDVILNGVKKIYWRESTDSEGEDVSLVNGRESKSKLSYSLAGFHYCMQNEVTSQHLSLALGP